MGWVPVFNPPNFVAGILLLALAWNLYAKRSLLAALLLLGLTIGGGLAGLLAVLTATAATGHASAFLLSVLLLIWVPLVALCFRTIEALRYLRSRPSRRARVETGRPLTNPSSG
jgi:hypothetical protein